MSYHSSNNTRRGHWRDRSGDRSYDERVYSFGRRSQGNNRYQAPTLTEEEHKLVYQGQDELFHKKKSFSSIPHLKDKTLLLSQNLFNTDRWEINELMVLKKRLNDTRDRLNEKDIQVWKQHTSKTNMTGRVVWSLRDRNDIEMCTNAWIKMAEIFAKYKNLIPSKYLPPKKCNDNLVFLRDMYLSYSQICLTVNHSERHMSAKLQVLLYAQRIFTMIRNSIEITLIH